MKPEGVAYLLELPRFADAGSVAYRPGFDRIRTLLDAMGRPHEAYRVCHVGGTNGKGSTASMIASIMTASGLRTGLHTSPHLLTVTERMRIDGHPADEAWLDDRVEYFRSTFEKVGPSFFEATVALSLLYFKEQHVDVAVVEVGLGGRLDATNILTPSVSVITTVGLEHTDILGSTIAEIATEKAGIIKPGIPIVSHAPDAVAREIIRRIATERGSPHITPDDVQIESGAPSGGASSFSLHTPRADYGVIELDLQGKHQISNAALAVLASEQMHPNLAADTVRSALSRVRVLSGLRGRLEEIRRTPRVVVDVAHNADGIAAAVEHVRHQSGGLGIILALMRDKDVGAIISVVKEPGITVRTVPVSADRMMPSGELAGCLQASGVDAAASQDINTALAELHDSSSILIVGSHLLAAEALTLLSAD